METGGFGFISAEDGREIFFQHTGVAGEGFDSLQEGDLATFGIKKGEKGSKAINQEKD